MRAQGLLAQGVIERTKGKQKLNTNNFVSLRQCCDTVYVSFYAANNILQKKHTHNTWSTIHAVLVLPACLLVPQSNCSDAIFFLPSLVSFLCSVLGTIFMSSQMNYYYQRSTPHERVKFQQSICLLFGTCVFFFGLVLVRDLCFITKS